MTTLYMGIASPEAMKARTLAIAAGGLKPKPDDPQVWLPSTDHLAKVFSNKNRTLLQAICRTRPDSITTLAARTGQGPASLSRTLHRLARYGLVRLHSGPRGQVRPDVPFDDLQVTIDLVQDEAPTGARPQTPGCFGPDDE